VKETVAPEEVAMNHHLKKMEMMRRKDRSTRQRGRSGRRHYVNRLKEGGVSRDMLDALEMSSTGTRHQISTSGSSPVWNQFRSRNVAMPSLLLHLHVGADCDYEPSETVRIRLLGYAFSGMAAKLFQEVMGEAPRGITAEEVWTLRAAKRTTTT
jgi:hypothetical protein